MSVSSALAARARDHELRAAWHDERAAGDPDSEHGRAAATFATVAIALHEAADVAAQLEQAAA